MTGVRDHRELDCWILANQASQAVMTLVRTGRLSTHPWLSAQLARAADSSCSNLAEGFSRFNPRDFARFATIAKASLTEVIEHLKSANQLGLVTSDEYADISSLARRARGATTRLILYLKSANAPNPLRQPRQSGPQTPRT
jgi:four helix bundle protein